MARVIFLGRPMDLISLCAWELTVVLLDGYLGRFAYCSDRGNNPFQIDHSNDGINM
jgi:hypothetical protein